MIHELLWLLTSVTAAKRSKEKLPCSFDAHDWIYCITLVNKVIGVYLITLSYTKLKL